MSVTAELPDSDLVARMACGDRDAFAALFRRHQATVYRFSRQMLGSREAAEDVTQDVFVALAKSAHRFDRERGSLSTYLYGVARHLILQRHKRSRAHVEVDVDSVEDLPAPAAEVDPADALTRAQMIRHLRMAILRLPVHYREVLVLCELNGLSYEDAARIAGCPVGTVRSRLSRARQILTERCTTRWTADRAGGGGHKTSESKRRWLIPTKNDC
jgi:RNA polymerase sigma-70 factor (ECF subfamily)